MFNIRVNEKGVALFMVLGTLLIVVILANIIMNIILSHSRLTHHQVSRIQAYYAAQAGMNYALERLRTGLWTFSPDDNSCPNTDPPTCIVNDPNFPVSIQSVGVIFCPAGTTCTGSSTPCAPPAGINFCVNTTADYTYTP